MHDCKAHGGHFFVHSPQIRSFVCDRCRTAYRNYNLPTARTASAKQWYAGLQDQDRPKAPWRCIVPSCAFVVCLDCADRIQLVLRDLHLAREAAQWEGIEFVMEAEVAKAEEEGGGRLGASVPVPVPATAGHRSAEDTGGGGGGAQKRLVQRRPAVAPITAAAAANSNNAKRCIIDTGPMEVGLVADDTDNDDNGDDYAGGNAYDPDFLRMRTVRRAADAGAAAAATAAMAGSTFAHHHRAKVTAGRRPILSSSVAPRNGPAGAAGRTSPPRPAD